MAFVFAKNEGKASASISFERDWGYSYQTRNPDIAEWFWLQHCVNKIEENAQ